MNNFFHNEGFKGGLKATSTKQIVPMISIYIEGFLREVESQLIEQVSNKEMKKKPLDKVIAKLSINLKKCNEVVIVTNKTNSFQVVPIEKYKICAGKHLESLANLIEVQRIIEIFDLVMEMQEKHEDILGEKEYICPKKKLLTKTIITPKLITKEHQKMN